MSCKNCSVYMASFIANLMAFAVGAALTLPLAVFSTFNLATDNAPPHILASPDEDSWPAAFLSFGLIFGPLIGGYASKKIGRKPALLAGAPPVFVSFLLLVFTKNIYMLYTARFLAGLGAGIVFIILPIYLSEIAEKGNRGALSGLMMVFVSCGQLFSYVCEGFCSVQEVCVGYLMVIVGFVGTFAFYNAESPVFLVYLGKVHEAKQSLRKLKTKAEDEIQMEITQLQEFNKRKLQLEELFKEKNIRRGLLICIVLAILQQLSGGFLVYLQLQPPFNKISIIIGAIQVVGTALSSALVDRLGRKPLLLLSLMGSAMSLTALGLSFYLLANNFNVSFLEWLPVTSLVVYIFMFNIGLASIPWTLMSELFLPDAKSFTSSLIGVVSFLCAFIAKFFFPPLYSAIGVGPSFWSFAGICIGGTVFVWWVLPETKRRSWEEIQELLKSDTRL